jgi:imidazolonepropionase-like amidohydrolase/Tol biopolymer transport system component
VRAGRLGLPALALPALLAAQDAAPARKWSVEEIHGPARKIAFTVDEGTWMSIDVSPDGRTLIFDLLGDLYTLPIGGGKATRLTSGTRWDATPRYSPDGKRILFASDASGSDQLWIMPAEGGTPTQLTQEGRFQYSQPAWDPSGNFVFSVRHRVPFAPTEFVMLHVGGGQGTAVTDSGASGLVASTDGRWLYHAMIVTNYGGETGRIVRIDRRTGDKLTIVSGYEQVRRPVVSHDGRLLAFAATIDAKSVLLLRDLESGRDRILSTGLPVVPRYTNEDLDALPGYAFLPDDRSIVFTGGGKIRRVSVASGEVSVIPFTADVDLTVIEPIAAKHKLIDGPFQPKVLHWVQRLDPDRLLVHAAGKLYRYQISTHQATPFAHGSGFQFAPAVSPDGGTVVYVDWTDDGGGRLTRIPAAGGAPVPLGARPGRYQSIAWSSDGKRLVVAEQDLEPGGLVEQGYRLHWIDLARPAELHYVISVAPRGNWRKPVQRPTFDATGERIYYAEAGTGGNVQLCSVDLTGADKRCIVKSNGADDLVPSPDGKWLAFTQMHNVYLVPLPATGKEPVEVSPSGGQVPAQRLSPQGDFIYWRDGGRKLIWAWGPVVYEADVAGAPDGRPTPVTTTVAFELPRALPKGRVLLRNARVITMKGNEVIDRGDILVADGRIAAVGRTGQVRAPAGVTTIDLTGKTVIPGFVDLHAHYILGGSQIQGDLHAEQNPSLLANLAYGVTTWRDPSIRSHTLFALAEMVEAGNLVGPRLHGTGDIFMFLDEFCCGMPENLDEARRVVRNQKALGATSIKEHTLPRRDQVQWVIQASREEGLQVVEDPARGPRRELRPLMDGATSLEHPYAAIPIQKDVIELFARTGTYYVPTLVVGGFENYFMTMLNPHDDAKLRRFTPHARLDAEIHARNQWLMPHEVPVWHGEAVRDLVKGGAKVGMGSHGQLQGLGTHWEIWAMASGGLPPIEAIRAATINGAEAMGMDADLGSLEPGKLADLIVLDRNPLADIKNTNSIRYVMKAGTLRNGDTLDEVWPTKRVRPRGSWEGQ